MNFSDYKKLLKKYYAGESSEVEKRLVEAWYDSFEEELRLPNGLESVEEKRQIRERLRRRLNVQVRPLPHLQRKRFRKAGFWMSAAAAIIIVISATYWWTKGTPDMLPLGHDFVQQGYQRFAVGPGQHKELKLADGSTVTLNANSSIDIMKNFGKGKRIVKLKGEAFFKVEPAVKSPFYVCTEDVLVQVLGTSFNVKAYGYRRKVRVAVNSGKVRISNATNTDEKVLGNGESYDYDRDNRRFIKRDSGNDAAWLYGDIGLERVGFAELALSFRDVHGVSLHSNDTSVRKSQYTLKLKYKRSAVETVQTICHMLNKQYRKEENGDLTIY